SAYLILLICPVKNGGITEPGRLRMIIALYWYLLFLFIWDAIRTFEKRRKTERKTESRDV
ncbi:hypothetical protein, partial [Klebsiella pneumoniae]